MHLMGAGSLSVCLNAVPLQQNGLCTKHLGHEGQGPPASALRLIESTVNKAQPKILQHTLPDHIVCIVLTLMQLCGEAFDNSSLLMFEGAAGA